MQREGTQSVLRRFGSNKRKQRRGGLPLAVKCPLEGKNLKGRVRSDSLRGEANY